MFNLDAITTHMTELATVILPLAPIIISLMALYLSCISYYRSNVPLTITTPIANYHTGNLHIHQTQESFLLMSEAKLIVISFRIINPQASNISFFNIGVFDDAEPPYAYNPLCKRHFGLEDSHNVYLILDSSGKEFLKLNLPLSGHQDFKASAFSHFDIAIELEDILKRHPSSLTIFFRDSRFRFFKTKCRGLPGQIKMNHPYHTYNIPLDNLYTLLQESDK